MITQQELKQRLHYDPETGIWFWLKGNRVGKVAGVLQGNSRGKKSRYISIDYKRHPASHLAFFYMTGQWPLEEMDHINRDALDDRWFNLRPATRSENEWNKSAYKNNKSGHKGVYLHRTHSGCYWIASIRRNGNRVSLGTFASAEMAAEAYETAARQWQMKLITSA
jgi:hypothetical protein